jgi:hypothetical protein
MKNPDSPCHRHGPLQVPSGRWCRVYISHGGEDIFVDFLLDAFKARFPELKVSSGEPNVAADETSSGASPAAMAHASVGKCGSLSLGVPLANRLRLTRTGAHSTHAMQPPVDSQGAARQLPRFMARTGLPLPLLLRAFTSEHPQDCH